MSNLTKKFCPKCMSEDVTPSTGGLTGNWMCKNCGYIGPVMEKTPIKEVKKNE